MYVLDVSTSSRAPLTNSNWSVPGGSRPLCQCQTKSDGVRTTTVEKADAVTGVYSPVYTTQSALEEAGL